MCKRIGKEFVRNEDNAEAYDIAFSLARNLLGMTYKAKIKVWSVYWEDNPANSIAVYFRENSHGF